MFNSSFPSKPQDWRLRVVKEEDMFIKELGLIEDIFMPSRRSSLNWVRLPMTLFQTGALIKNPFLERSSETSEDNCEISTEIWPKNPESERLR